MNAKITPQGRGSTLSAVFCRLSRGGQKRTAYVLAFFLVLFALLPLSQAQAIPKPAPEVAVVIIGRGPSALACASITTHSGMPTAILYTESLEPQKPGLETAVEMAPLFFANTWGEAMTKLSKEVKEELVIANGSGVKSIQGSYPKFQITTHDNTLFQASSIVLALGAEPRSLGVPDEKKFVNQGLSYQVYDPSRYANKRVAIVGDSPEAWHQVQQITPYAAQVYYIGRYIGKIADKAAKNVIRREGEIVGINQISKGSSLHGKPGDETLSLSIRTRSGLEEMSVNHLFVLNGSYPRSALVSDFVDCDSRGFVITTIDTQKTSLPGVFACGTLTSQKAFSLSEAIGQGAQAGNEARNFLLESGINPKQWKSMAEAIAKLKTTVKAPQKQVPMKGS